LYAIFRAQGKQFEPRRVKPSACPAWRPKRASTVTFDEVLLASDGDTITAGTPMIKGASVTAEVIGYTKGEKIYVFRFKRRKNVRRKTGHRAKFTDVRITGVKVG
jgi:large subunit ribosomal protein L21